MTAATTGGSRAAASSDGGRGSRSGSVSASAIEVRSEGTTIVLAVRAQLDEAIGEALVQTARAAVSAAPDRLDIDLRELPGFTAAGAAALVRCRALVTGLAEGLHYRTGRGPGRDALLSAYRAVDEDVEPV